MFHQVGPILSFAFRLLSLAFVFVIPLLPKSGSAAVENVIWTDPVCVTITGNSMQKISSSICGLWEGGAISQQQITSGDGYMEFTASDASVVNTAKFVGLTNISTGIGYAEIDFAIRLEGNNPLAEVRENGLWKWDTPFADSDVFRVAIESGVVKYYKNGSLFYTSNVAPTYPLVADGRLLGDSGSINNAVIDPGVLGGFVEKSHSTNVRPILTQLQIQSFLPSTRAKFTFPAPYNTEGVRLTIPSDCPIDDPLTPLNEADCVWYVGYSYWRNINNHVGSDTMLIFLGLDRGRGGQGPTLFSFNKTTNEVKNLGPLFDAASPFSWHSAESWYFSASQPTKLYVHNNGPQLYRYDVISKSLETAMDISSQFGSDKYIYQVHSSNDDKAHSFTLRQTGTWAVLGCAAYREDSGQYFFYPVMGDFDECQIDKSGRWLVIKENVDGLNGEDNRIIDLQTGTERVLLDQDGAGGHSDAGYGYMVAADNWNSLPFASRLWKFDLNPLQGPVVYYQPDWNTYAPQHVSHTNAKAGIAPEQQYACGSSANQPNGPRGNEIICFRPDGAFDVLVVAPVMTDMNASGGGDSYAKQPKGNLDVTGRYFIWTSNMADNRLDAFIVKVPDQCLYRAPQRDGPC